MQTSNPTPMFPINPLHSSPNPPLPVSTPPPSPWWQEAHPGLSAVTSSAHGARTYPTHTESLYLPFSDPLYVFNFSHVPWWYQAQP